MHLLGINPSYAWVMTPRDDATQNQICLGGIGNDHINKGVNAIRW
jgi:hypothetical protein